MMFGGRPRVIDEVEAGCAAILQAWYPGEEGEMLLLISCWVMLILPENFVSVILRQKVKNFIVIIMVFLQEKIAYPFDFGLSYTSFEYSGMNVPATAQTTDDFIEISCRVKNTGMRKGVEIVQLYLSPESSQSLKPINS